jgi:valyl-tRNA synthetase
MDSSISELAMLKYKSDDKFFKKAYPATLRPQGKEIIRTWLYYTILRGYLETAKPCFKDVWINQHITDAKGYKMSKSKGNVIDPQKLLKNYGAEAIRFWASTEGDLSKNDLKCSEEKIKAELKTLNKILNLSKFVLLFEKPTELQKPEKLDKLFIDYLEDFTKRTEENYEKYDFYHPAIELRRFIWDIFASNYVELIKARAYNRENKFSKKESDSAKYTLHYLLERFLILAYPIIPQITTTIATEKRIDLLNTEFPKSKKINSDLKLIEKIIEFNSNVWKAKKEKGKGLRDEITGIKIPKELKDFEKDLTVCHNLK